MSFLALVQKKLTLIDKLMILTLSDYRFRSSLAALNNIVLFDHIAESLMAIASPYRGNRSKLCLCHVMLKILFAIKSCLQLLFDISSFESEAYLYTPMDWVDISKINYLINFYKLEQSVSVTRLMLDFHELHNATVRPCRMDKRKANLTQMRWIKPQS